MKKKKNKKISYIDSEKNEGKIRTDIHCHNCTKIFIALLDYDIDGQKIAICPHCQHRHCRVIKDGRITDDRWSSFNDNDMDIENCTVWKADVLETTMTSASVFLRDKWLNHGQG